MNFDPNNKNKENGHTEDKKHGLGHGVNIQLSSVPSTPKLGEKTPKSRKFAKKVPKDAEGAILLIGGHDSIKKPACAFIRLHEGLSLPGMCEVEVPVRFFFILVGPTAGTPVYTEIARCMGALLSSQNFRDDAYSARFRADLIDGINDFMTAGTLLPTSTWDHTIRIEPPSKIEPVTWVDSLEGKDADEEAEKYEDEHDKIRRTGRLFGGLIQDVKRKAPFYASDFKDAIHIQTIGAMVFAYFASLSTTITFGGMMGDAVDRYMGGMESLVSATMCGVSYALLAGQPLTILGATGPILVFETILYHFSHDNGWDFMSFRVWVGIWAALFIMICVMLDLSALVSYITRFTEESFAVLIGLIFIFEAIKNVVKISEKQQVHLHWHTKDMPPEKMRQFFYESCRCNVTAEALTKYNMDTGVNSTVAGPTYSLDTNTTTGPMYSIPAAMCRDYNGTLFGPYCNVPHYVPDVFFFSFICFIAVFAIAWGLKMFRTTRFLPTMARTTLNDFAVPIAIIIVTAIDYAVDLDTPKLDIPLSFAPTRPDRGWYIPPLGHNPWWTILAAALPAALLAILVFMDQQITAVIVNNARFKLQKGPGYHLDLFLISLQMVGCSIMGIPFFVAATVRSINHIQSLGRESKEAAPGEKPKFLGTREQRVTHLVAFILIGVSTLMAPILTKVPMAVLYGIFLYMGIGSLKGVQLMDRLQLLFMPAKYQPDYPYLRKVAPRRVHLFTFIQVLFLVIMWVVKSIKKISIAFPLMVLALCFVRKALDFVFTQNELRALDDLLPAINTKKHKRGKHTDDEKADTELLSNNKDSNENEMKDIKAQDA